jgi:hypothetical protein
MAIPIQHGELTFHLYRDKQHEWRWRLTANNGKTIADSGEGYNNMTDAEHAISLIMDQSHEATIEFNDDE